MKLVSNLFTLQQPLLIYWKGASANTESCSGPPKPHYGTFAFDLETYNAQASRSTRAILLRQRPAHTLGFILIKRGPHDWIGVSEPVAIGTLRPPGNKGQCRPTRSKNRPRRRNRPPPRFRQGRRQSCFWSSVVCVQQLVSKRRRKEACPFGNLGPSWSVQSPNFQRSLPTEATSLFCKS